MSRRVMVRYRSTSHRGPAQALDPVRRDALRRDLDAFHAYHAVDAGLHLKRENLVVIGRRR